MNRFTFYFLEMFLSINLIFFFISLLNISNFQTPNLREKSILLVKMMTYIEKRFPDELELNAQFLELVNYVYR